MARWVTLLGIGSLVILLVFSRLLATEVGEEFTRNTVLLALGWYAVALCLMMRLAAYDWLATTDIGRLTRCCWTWAYVSFLVHVLMAFHYYHQWAHAHAFEHTRQVAGAGEGLYVSYLFTGLWSADVAAWWLRPGRYSARPG
jgi:hypothetical protein